MSFLERMQRLARSNLNALLDLADDPEQALDEGVRELEQAVQEAKGAVAAYAVAHGEIERALADAEQARDACQREAEDALADGREEAARAALARRVRCDDRVERLTPECLRSAETLAHLRENLHQVKEQQASAQQKMAELKSRRRAADAQQSFHAQASVVRQASEQKAVRQLREEVERAEAEAMVAARTADPEMDLEALSEQLRVERALEALKAGDARDA